MTPQTESTAGLVLAGGLSRRMGRDKLALGLGGETLLDRCLRIGREAGLDPIVAVLSTGSVHLRDRPVADDRRGEASGVLRVHVPVTDPPTQAASIRAGAGALPSGVGTVVLLLADMPFVTPELIRRLASGVRVGASPAVAVDRDGRPAPPMALRRSVLDAMAAAGDRRAFLESLGEDLDLVSVDPDLLLDVDTAADYARAVTAVEGTGPARPTHVPATP